MRKLIGKAMCVVLAAAAQAWAKDPSGTDIQYVTQVGHSSRFEIEASQMAVQRGSNDYIRDFAKRMVSDHTRIEAEFKAYASSRNMSLPTDPDVGQKAVLASLGGKTGPSYDREFAQEVGVDAHQRAIRLFEEMAVHATDGQLQALAKTHLPTLREHERHAKELLAKVESGEAQRPRQEGGNPGPGIPHPIPPDRASPPVTAPSGEPDRGTPVPSR